MSELKEEELLGQIDTWLICCRSDAKKVYGSCKKCPCKEGCDQAEKQIREMIQKPKVTEDWIEDKARELLKWWDAGGFAHLKTCKDFIHSLVEEIHGRK